MKMQEEALKTEYGRNRKGKKNNKPSTWSEEVRKLLSEIKLEIRTERKNSIPLEKIFLWWTKL